MIEISFDPNATLLRFECKIEFQTTAGAILALDTGASSVTLSRPILERIGYNLDAVMEHESFGNASQSHTVPKITLKALSIETARLENVDVLVIRCLLNMALMVSSD